MRIAVVADIHGNRRALEAVIADIAARGVDEVINLGDCVSGPLEAAETADLLMRLGWLTVRGNHDRWLTEKAPGEMWKSDRAAFTQLAPRHLDWLRALPPNAVIADEVLLVHGTPSDDNSSLTEIVTPHGVFNPPEETLRAELVGSPQRVILCGHTHVPRLFLLGDGRAVFNPGSIGLPAVRDDTPWDLYVMEVGSPHARYGIIERTPAGWRFEHHAVAYDWAGASAVARAAGREDWAHALATGFAL